MGVAGGDAHYYGQDHADAQGILTLPWLRYSSDPGMRVPFLGIPQGPTLAPFFVFGAKPGASLRFFVRDR